jgi:hypothetical protein
MDTYPAISSERHPKDRGCREESTILEEDLNDAYLMMKHVEQPPST